MPSDSHRLHLTAKDVERMNRLNDMATLLAAEWAKAEPDHGVTKFPTSYVATWVDIARAVLKASPVNEMGRLILDIHCPTGPVGAEICPKCYCAYPCRTAEIAIRYQYG